jgi:hypothetical protein
MLQRKYQIWVKAVAQIWWLSFVVETYWQTISQM